MVCKNEQIKNFKILNEFAIYHQCEGFQIERYNSFMLFMMYSLKYLTFKTEIVLTSN